VQIGSSTWSQVSVSVAGSPSTLGIKTDGTLWAWGLNDAGQLGDGTTTSHSSPVQIGSSSWLAVSEGSSFTIGIKSDGTLWGWGNNSYGQLGDGTSISHSAPAQIGKSSWLAVSAGDSFVLAIKSDGTLWGWGNNIYGQLGDGTTTPRYFPVQIGASVNWSQVSGGVNSSFGITSDGSLWAWGSDNLGQLGDNTTQQRLSPMQIGASQWMLPPTPSYTLTLAKAGSGTGTVTSSPAGISCGSTCSATYTAGTSVVLTAAADTGYGYSWTGCDSSSGAQCTVAMAGNKTVTAAFGLTYTLTVNNSGNGTITSSPSGISCGSACSTPYAAGASVTLTATPNTGYTFSSWSGCDSTSGSECTIAMSSDKSVSAVFKSTNTLTVKTVGAGTALIMSSPAGISCGTTCSYSYVTGTAVTITATPNAGFSLIDWSGCDSRNAFQCIVTMSSDKSVAAVLSQSTDYVSAQSAISAVVAQYPVIFGSASGSVTIGTDTSGVYYVDWFSNGKGILAWTDGYLYYYSGTGWWVSMGITWRSQSDFDKASAGITSFYNQYASLFGSPSGGITSGSTTTGAYYVEWFTNGSAIVAWADGYMYYIYGGNTYSFDMPWKTLSTDDKATQAINTAYTQNVSYYGTPSGGIVKTSTANGAYYVQVFVNGTGILAWTDGYLYYYSGGSWVSLGTAWNTSTAYDKASKMINYYSSLYTYSLGMAYGNIIGGTTSSGTSYSQWFMSGSAIIAWTDGKMYYYAGSGSFVSLGGKWQ
ncbi:MAG: hypothetical protein HQK97_12470, partial [Nitrospirae bacterium]|nr:hypothetical protein [Nitrospirota bacterium]